MKIVVFTDTHANLPALLAFREAIEREGYDLAFHTGDAIDIGPFPAECLEVLFKMPRTEFVLGNHDAIIAFGMPDPLPYFMEENEAQHCRWTAEQVEPSYREQLARWPFYIQQEFNGTRVTFVHYGLNAARNDFVHMLKRRPSAADLDEIFGHFDTDLLFYGHHHPFSDVQGRARYVNPGALGCFYRPLARYCVVQFDKTGYKVTYRAVPYDDTELLTEFERRDVPARDFILKEFFGKNID